MRNLRISTQDSKYTLSDVPEKYEFIQNIAKQYSNSQEELELYLQAGIIAYEKLEATDSKRYFEKVVLWTVRQAIIEKANEQQ